MSAEVQTTDDYTALITELVGARICHDLVSPIGALSNGIELLQMTMQSSAPEMDLLKDSVRSANARIQLFRLAFGTVGQTPFRGSDFYQMLSDAGGARVNYDWQGPDVAPKDEFKLLALAIMCLETAVPFGGNLRVTSTAPKSSPPQVNWHLKAEGDRLNWDDSRWALLQAARPSPPLTQTVNGTQTTHPPTDPGEM